jgi:hypothetical protein
MRRLMLSLVALAAACGGGTHNSSPDLAPAISSASELNSMLAQLNCTVGAQCGNIGKSEVQQCLGDLTTSEGFKPTYSIDDAVKAGRVKFDPAEAQRCYDAQSKFGCTQDEVIAAQASCTKVLTGLVQTGGMCLAQLECADGFCDQGNNTQRNDGCAGTCKPWLNVGDTCDPQSPLCAPTAFCDNTTMKCAAQLSMGTACTPGSCGADLFCKGYVAASAGPPAVPETKGSCLPAGKLGDACQAFFFGNTDCSPDFFCDTSQTTAVCATKVAMGGACKDFAACVDGLDCLGLTFDMNGNLSKSGACGAYVDVGATCDPAGGEAGCPFDAPCDATAKTCTITGTEGSDCSMTSCRTNLYCDDTTMKCTKQVALGAACTPPQMLGTNPCHDGTCDTASKICSLACM